MSEFQLFAISISSWSTLICSVALKEKLLNSLEAATKRGITPVKPVQTRVFYMSDFF
jgi:hypothetical protein